MGNSSPNRVLRLTSRMTPEFRVAPTLMPTVATKRARRPVVAVAACALIVELVLAATTYGTNDITSWMTFARAVGLVGPVRVYGYHFTNDIYNHPPLVGYFLLAINDLNQVGLHLNFTLRAVSSICGTASALLIFDLVRPRHSLKEASRAGVAIAASPVIVAVSGFHGNTDPIFIMFMIGAVLFLVDRDRPFSAGAMLAVGMSIKIVAALIVPALVVWLWKQERRRFLSFICTFLGLLLLIWIPAAVTEWSPLLHNVLGYGGVSARPWGLPQFAVWAGLPGVAAWLAGGVTRPSSTRLLSVAGICCASQARTCRGMGRVVSGRVLAAQSGVRCPVPVVAYRLELCIECSSRDRVQHLGKCSSGRVIHAMVRKCCLEQRGKCPPDGGAAPVRGLGMGGATCCGGPRRVDGDFRWQGERQILLWPVHQRLREELRNEDRVVRR